MLQVNSSCVEGLCGRAFMRLALGDENDCVNDVAVACDLDLYTVIAHIHALPVEAKKLLLFWIGKWLCLHVSYFDVLSKDKSAIQPAHDEKHTKMFEKRWIQVMINVSIFISLCVC